MLEKHIIYEVYYNVRCTKSLNFINFIKCSVQYVQLYIGMQYLVVLNELNKKNY